MNIKEEIINLAKEIGISKIGFTTADDFDYLEKSLRLAVEEGRNSGFEHKNIEERIKPKLSLDSAKTIISIAVAYPHKLKQQPQKTSYKRGKFTPNSWGLDYHYVLQDKLDRLARGIEALTADFEYKGMVDTGALVDTAVAQRAGIGFIGKNGLVISKEFGSYMFLGELITNLDIEPDQPVDYGCGDCNRCVTACPTSCLIGDGSMNAKRCLSFQTQDKGVMDLEFRKKTVISAKSAALTIKDWIILWQQKLTPTFLIPSSCLSWSFPTVSLRRNSVMWPAAGGGKTSCSAMPL